MSAAKKTLVIQVKTPDKVQTYEIDKSEFVFGRSNKADVITQENGISREHIRFKIENDIINICDLGSLNGTYIDGYKILPNEYIAIQEKSSITFGNCEVTLGLNFRTLEEEVPDSAPVHNIKEEVAAYLFEDAVPVQKENPITAENPPAFPPNPEPKPKFEVPHEAIADLMVTPENNKLIDLSAFPKKEEDYKLNFKNVGLDLPKYKNPGEHAKEIISEANYQKRAILKSAEVFKSKTINDTRILAKKASDEAYAEYKKLIDILLADTRDELNRARVETEIILDEKRIQANEEIQKLWAEHEDQMRAEKAKQLEIVEKENQTKLDLMIEKMRSDMFSERHKIISEAETEIIQKKHKLQVEIESEKTEHELRLKIYKDELQKTQISIEEHKHVYKETKAQRDQTELELSKAVSQLKVEKENLELTSQSYQEALEGYKKIETELANFNETKAKAISEIKTANEELKKINTSYANLSEKKHLIEQELESLTNLLNDSKAKAKAEVENEYALIKKNEAKKFEDFKANELKELQKIRDSHTESIKNFSVDLSQEIATKLELLASKNSVKFDFEKNFELINSVIQIKSSINTGSESKHEEQLDNWKTRKRKENFTLLSKGFAAGLVVVFLGYTAYKKLNIDPMLEERARIARENKEKDLENVFTPEKTDKYYNTYVDSTLYTQGFSETYLDKDNQREWVNYATKYFLRQWKVDEEKVIQVISNSNALVQNVVETMPTMKKTRLKTDLAKLKELEDEYVKNQASILGTNVKYEAYKKIEKDFFLQKMANRKPANQ